MLCLDAHTADGAFNTQNASENEASRAYSLPTPNSTWPCPENVTPPPSTHTSPTSVSSTPAPELSSAGPRKPASRAEGAHPAWPLHSVGQRSLTRVPAAMSWSWLDRSLEQPPGKASKTGQLTDWSPAGVGAAGYPGARVTLSDHAHAFGHK